MSLLGALADWVTGGGVTGLLASTVGAFTKYKTLKLQLEHQRKEWAYEYRMHRLEREARREAMQAGLELVTEAGASAAFTASLAGEAQVSTAAMANERIPGWVLGLRVALRPVLTLMLFFAMITAAFVPIPVVEAGTQPSEVASTVVLTVQQAFLAALGWWFGQRLISPTDFPRAMGETRQ